MAIEIGSWVWVPDEEECVLPAQVIEFSPGKSGKFKLEDGTEKSLDAQGIIGLETLDPQCLDREVSNLIGLSNLSENAILHNLRIRFRNDEIYTFVSSILIAVNPFRQLPLYGVETLEKYRSTVDKSSLPPHIFTIADNAFKAMMSDDTAQSVVISGESGAGKTESTKLLLEFIAELSGKSSQGGDSIQQQILQCNPVMEAFGNAKTVRNNNSSRFGKLITIKFEHGSIRGASIISYLLEKSRVVHQQDAERNYHYFYQIVAAAADSPELAKTLLLSDTDEHYYISQSSINVIEGVSDLEEFNEVQSAMEVLGMNSESQMDVNKTVAGILHLGNIKFSSTTTSGDVAAKIDDPALLVKASTLLGLTQDELQRCLTSKNIGTRSIITCTYTPAQACEARDALSKKLYANLFDWLIKAINQSLEGQSAELKGVFIAVLDIFGFEAFTHNSFEQLCINYCNEKLQFHFNNHIFLMEQQEYLKEGVSMIAIQFEDNQPTLDLLDMKATGIFSMIDEEINVPRGSDEGLLSKIFQKHGSHPSIQRPKPKVHKNAQECFVVVHYAGEVPYNVLGFLEKNKDTLSADLEDLGKHSTSTFVSELFKLNSEDSGTGETVLKRKPARTSTKKGKSTLGAQFKQQLTTLMDTLNATEPHFVRCMKPNMEKIGRKFSSTVMLSQLRYAGLLEVCRIRQMGFPNRMPFEKFLRQYLVLQPSASSPQMLAELLSSSGQLPSSQYVIGNSKVFMKHSAATLLDSLRDKAYFVVATKTQKVARGYLKRKRFALFKKTLTNLNKSVTEKNQPLLEDAVASAIELPYEGVHIAIVKTAKDLLRRLKEENKVKKLLQDAIEDRQLAALEGALRTAKSMNPPLEDDLVSQAGSLIQLIKEEKQHLSSAASLIKVRELDSLEDWMDKAEQLNLLASDEARSVQALIDRINDENGLLEELENAIVSENLQTLSAYLTKATEMGLDDRPVFIEAKKCQHHLEELSAGKRALEISLESPDLDSLMSSMEKARACGVSNEEPLFLKAQHLHSLLSQVNEIEAALKVSIDNASLEDLSEQVQAAQNILLLVQGESALAAMNIEIHGISTAEALISSLTKKKQDDESELAKQDEVAEQIRCALQDKEFSYLRGLIAQAKGMGLSQGKYASLIKEADHVLETMRIAMDKEMALVAAIRMKDVSALNNAITKAQSGDTATVPGSLTSAIRLRDELVAQGSIVEEIKAAVESKNILILPELLQRAEQSNLTNRYVDDAKILLEREGNRNQIYKQLIDAQDQQSLSEALEKAIQIGLNNDIVEAARLRYDKMKDSTSAVEELKSAMRNLDVIRVSENGLSENDIAPLKFALSQVGSSDDSGLGPLVKEAEDTLARAQKQLELQATLSNITESTPIVEIKKSLRTSADAGIKNYIGFLKATAILKKLEEALGNNEMKVLAEESELTFETFDKMKDELYQEARQSNYVFSNYINLRNPEDFAKGVLLNKKKVMESFLKHQKTPINRSLLNLDNDENREALIAFKSLLGYCGDKAVTFPASQALDFLKIGINTPSLRNELYMQAIKQTLSNPSNYGQCRAFHILCLCCDTFPPLPDFFYYVVNFLLSHSDSIAPGTDPTPIQQMAQYCLVRIQAMQNTDPDKMPLSVDVEAIEAYSARLPTLAKIYSPDDLLLGELLVAPDVDVESLLTLLSSILNIHPSHQPLLGLYVVTTKSNPLAPMILLPDKDFHIGDICQAPLLQKFGRPIKFYVKRKLLGENSSGQFLRVVDEDPETPDQEQALVDLTFSQLSKRVIDDSIRIEDDQLMARLAALHLATEAEFLPGRPDIALNQGCLNYVSEQMREAHPPEYWGKLVADALHQCTDKEDYELKDEYLSILSQFPASSMHTYMCLRGTGCTAGRVSHIPEEVILGMDEHGLHFMDGSSDNAETTFTAKYLDIRKFAVKTSSIRFTLDSIDGISPPYDVELITPLNEEISQYCLIYRPIQQMQSSLKKASVSSNSAQSAAAQSRLERLANLGK